MSKILYQKKNAHKQNTQNGNVLFLILIGVALFAALSYAVTSSTRSSGGNANSEKDGLYAAAITQYGTAVSVAVQRMNLSNNCSDTEISFETNLSDYNFVHSPPTRNECKLFHPSGGGIAYQVPAAWLEDPAAWSRKEFWASGSYEFEHVGTQEPDLTIEIRGLKESVCNEINKKLGVQEPTINYFNGWSEDFNGIYNPYPSTGFTGPMSGCFFNGEPDVQTYVYYQIVLAR